MTDINNIYGSNNVFDNLGLSGNINEAKPNELGQEDFLTLLVAQVNNQDPFDPQSSGDFMGQLAQFGTVDGIGKLQQSVAVVNAAMYSNQALQASAMVGRHVEVLSHSGYLSAENEMTGTVILPADTNNISLTIKNDSGEIVKKLYLGNQEAGLVDYQWNGIGDDGQPCAPGTYHLSAEGEIGKQHVSLATTTNAHVDSVTLGEGGTNIALNIGELGKVSIYDVVNIS